MKRICLLVSLFLITPVLHAEDNLAIPAMILQFLDQCYDNEAKTGPDLAKCVLKKLEHKKNPEGYKINFTQDSFNRKILSSFTLIIYNKQGLTITCRGVASDKIHIQSCSSEKKAPLSEGKELSITPPE
ncbi:MAG: hypothetical protein H0T84_05355 [Tatlockia sp.]|nr:hypothetical protein [Tatlockia sp.]